MTDALPAISAVLIASLLGSLHCAGMCGGLVLFAVGSDGKLEKRAPLHLAYHGMRGLAYITLGAVAGVIGAAADITTKLDHGLFGAGTRASAIIAGVLIIAFGLISLARCAGAGVRLPKLPPRLQKLTESLHRRAFALPPVARAAAVGLLTPLLPCGWLYAFVIVAGGTGHPLFGAAIMAAFWAGTVPVLATLGIGLQTLTGPLRKRLPLLTSLVVVGLGVMTAMGRINVPSVAPHVAGDSLDEQVDAAANLEHGDLPCCFGSDAPAAQEPGE